MGAVYKGLHAVMHIDVAVKVMLPSVAADQEQVVQRFVREARLAAQIDHPNVIRVMNVASSGPLHYMVMEYVEGANAEELVRARGRLPEQEAVKIVLDAAAGLKAAYEQCGLRHRDVKPTNLLIRAKDGRVKVSDLGLAKGADPGRVGPGLRRALSCPPCAHTMMRARGASTCIAVASYEE
jgi:serine/threonine-protein kinase